MLKAKCKKKKVLNGLKTILMYYNVLQVVGSTKKNNLID